MHNYIIMLIIGILFIILNSTGLDYKEELPIKIDQSKMGAALLERDSHAASAR